MRQRVSKELFAYWNELRGARAAPDRSDIDPGAIRQLLADTFILEVDADCGFPLRLSGTRVNALWRREQKGASFIELWREQDRRSISAAMMTVIEGVAPVVAGVNAHVPGDAQIELELLLLPLRHFGKTHSRVLGALSPIHQADWLGYLRLGPLKLVSMRVIETPAVHATSSHCHGFQPPQLARTRPRLVVYNGNKL